jgi:hypothetical protein
MQEQIITGAVAMDIGDGGVFGARVEKEIIHNIAQF